VLPIYQPVSHPQGEEGCTLIISFFHYSEVEKICPILSLLYNQWGGDMSLLVSFCINVYNNIYIVLDVIPVNRFNNPSLLMSKQGVDGF